MHRASAEQRHRHEGEAATGRMLSKKGLMAVKVLAFKELRVVLRSSKSVVLNEIGVEMGRMSECLVYQN